MDTKRKSSLTRLLQILAVLPLLAVLPAEAAIKCWTNNEGVRECGNVVPPEYAQQGHETKDSRGLTVGKTERAKSIEELEAERTAAIEAEKAAAEAKKRDALDRVLLDTFASEDDLILTRDGQIAHLDSQIRLTTGHIEKLQKNLDQMMERAADVERRGENPSKDLLDNINSVRDQITDNETFIATKQREQEEIRQRFASDIARFKELRGR
jgi:hypothetical protein